MNPTLFLKKVSQEIPSGFSNFSQALMALVVSRAPEITYWSIFEYQQTKNDPLKISLKVVIDGKNKLWGELILSNIAQKDEPYGAFVFFNQVLAKQHRKLQKDHSRIEKLFAHGPSQPLAHTSNVYKYKNSMGFFI